jgi:sialate O-acetylesterase
MTRWVSVPRVRCALLFTLLFSVATVASAAWRLPSVISDNMVMQCDQPVALWGWSDPRDAVTVTLGKQTKTAVADGNGKWSLKLEPLPASSEPQSMSIVSSKNPSQKSEIKNILVGEVWLASGQSNMGMTVGASNRAEEEEKAAEFPAIRMFTAARVTAMSPRDEVAGQWKICSPATVKGFSAAGYFFARELHRTLKVPVGILHSSWGGTPVEAWTSMDAQTATPEFKPVLDSWQNKARTYDPAKAKADYEKALAKWQAEAKAGNKPQGRKPTLMQNPSDDPHHPAVLFNGMIAPLFPYTLRGAIWYQGESNANVVTAPHYRTLLTTMIQDWRSRFGQGDFPFLFVQLANYTSSEQWVVVQDQMRKALDFPNTGMAVINDIGDAKDIHPKNKQEVGRRLAAWALVKTYGKPGVYSGPLYKSVEAKGQQMVVRFDCIGGGLEAKGGEPLKGFEIAGADKKFLAAKAEIQGDTVVVSCPAVAKPVAVRYAWACNPDCNLYNEEGLPASVFRTDE